MGEEEQAAAVTWQRVGVRGGRLTPFLTQVDGAMIAAFLVRKELFEFAEELDAEHESATDRVDGRGR